MKLYGVERSELEKIAKELGFKLYNVREGGVREPWVAFVLRMATPLPSKADLRWYDAHPVSTASDTSKWEKIDGALRYRARSPGSLAWGKPRWANGAVCWHGHKAFLDRVVDLNPGARFRSKLWRFDNAGEYRANVDATGMQNVGSMMRPVQIRECCDCYGG